MMEFAASRSAHADRVVPQDGSLSDGEVGFLWWFIQGGIMDGEVRARLCRGWGLCPRHSFAYLSVDAAFRHFYLHGPAVLYADLMTRARDAFALSGPLHEMRLQHRLRTCGPCHICAQGLGPDSKGFASPQHLAIGRNTESIRSFMRKMRPFWSAAVCGRCAGTAAEARCRLHLLESIADAGLRDPERQRALVEDITRHLLSYERSFRWEFNGTDTVEDRAGLISAVG
ncbi:MAG TPA: hypothetical protein VF450_20755 [Noviherbaspirillum sp.]